MSLSIELTADNITTLCNKSEGRDKVARFFQFAARAILGLIALRRPKSRASLRALEDKARSLMAQLAVARRTHRWGKEIPVVKGIIGNLPLAISTPFGSSEFADRSLELLQKLSLSAFLIIDHVGWLKQIKVLSGGKRAGTGTIQLGLKFFCASNFFAMLYELKKRRDARAEKSESSSKQSKCIENAIKHAMLVVQMAHLSRLYETHDSLVGFLGMLTSGMDVLAQWPAKGGNPTLTLGSKKRSFVSSGSPKPRRCGSLTVCTAQGCSAPA